MGNDEARPYGLINPTKIIFDNILDAIKNNKDTNDLTIKKLITRLQKIILTISRNISNVGDMIYVINL